MSRRLTKIRTLRVALFAAAILCSHMQPANALTCEEKITRAAGECALREGIMNGASCRKRAEKETNCGTGSSNRGSDAQLFQEFGPTFRTLSPEAETIVSKAGIGVEVASTEARCVAMLERTRGFIGRARAFERFEEKYLGPLGTLLTAIKVNNLRNRGQHTEANQETANFVLDSVVCNSGVHTCAAWMVGKTLGALISDGPKLVGLSDRTVNDWWTDKVAEFMNPGPTEQDFRRFEAEARRKIAENKLAAQSKSGCGR